MATQLKAVPSPTKIEKGIPIPAKKTILYPFADMQVGDSFFTPAPNSGEQHRIGGSIRTSARRFTPKQFTTRAVEGGLRTWRFA